MALPTKNEPTLGGLPSEVRLDIYSRLLAARTTLHFKSGKFLTIELPTDSGLSVLLVCKKFREEALDTFYQNTELHLTAPEDFEALLEKIGEMNLRRIRSFKFSYGVFQSTFVAKPETSNDLLSNIESLEVSGDYRGGVLLPRHDARARPRFMQHLQRIMTEHPKLRRLFALAPATVPKRSYARLVSTTTQPRPCTSPPNLEHNHVSQPTHVIANMPHYLWAPRHHCPAENTEEGCPKEIEIVDLEAKIMCVE